MEIVIDPASHTEGTRRSLRLQENKLEYYIGQAQTSPSRWAIKMVKVYADRVNGIMNFVDKTTSELVQSMDAQP